MYTAVNTSELPGPDAIICWGYSVAEPEAPFSRLGKTVTLYEYDPELRPGVLGADFEDGNPDHSFTLRLEEEDGEYLMRQLQIHFYPKPSS